MYDTRKLYAAYSRNEIKEGKRVLYELLSSIREEAYITSKMMSKEELLQKLPTCSYGEGFKYSGGWGPLKLPVISAHTLSEDWERADREEKELLKKYKKYLQELPVGECLSAGDEDRFSWELTATKISDNLFEVVIHDSLEQEWEEDRAKALYPWKGIRAAFFERCPAFEGDHRAFDALLALIRG